MPRNFWARSGGRAKIRGLRGLPGNLGGWGRAGRPPDRAEGKYALSETRTQRHAKGKIQRTNYDHDMVVIGGLLGFWR